MMSYTRQIADFAANLKLTDVPKEAIVKAKALVLDGLGCGLYGSDLRLTQITGACHQTAGAERWACYELGARRTASATSAALINGTMVQRHEISRD